MSRSLLAVYTFNQFLDNYQSPRIADFRQAEQSVFAVLEQASGFVARSGYDNEPGPESWGMQVFPIYWGDNGDGFAPSTLSLWESPEALMAATFHGHHGHVYRHGAEWHAHPAPWPNYVLWWVSQYHRPNWREAVEKLEYLGDQGPSPAAFTFKTLYDETGQARKADVALVRKLAAQNQHSGPTK